MKYVVQLSYTNPAHEHVSLRRRVDTVNRIIEAANENQAILRASQQQRALGFMIKEAKIVKEKEKMKKKEVVVDSNEKTEVAEAGGMKEEAEQEAQISEASKEGKSVMYGMRASMKAMDLRHGVDSDKRDSGYKMSPAVRAAQAKSDALSKVEKPVQAGTLAALKRREMKKEEVQYIEEKLSAGDPASKWISDFVASDNPKFAGKTKKERINMALGAYYAAKKGKNEEVEHVEEAADPGKLRVVNKKVEAQASKDTKKSEQKSKATEKAIDVAKSKKNPVNLKPVLGGDKVNNA